MTEKEKAIKIALLKAGVKQVDIAEKHGVTRGAVTQVIQGKAKSKKIEKELESILEVWGAAL